MLKFGVVPIVQVLVPQRDSRRNDFLTGGIWPVHHCAELTNRCRSCHGDQQTTHAVDRASPPQIHGQVALRPRQVGVESAQLWPKIDGRCWHCGFRQVACVRFLASSTQLHIHVGNCGFLQQMLFKVFAMLNKQILQSLQIVLQSRGSSVTHSHQRLAHAYLGIQIDGIGDVLFNLLPVGRNCHQGCKHSLCMPVVFQLWEPSSQAFNCVGVVMGVPAKPRPRGGRCAKLIHDLVCHGL